MPPSTHLPSPPDPTGQGGANSIGGAVTGGLNGNDAGKGSWIVQKYGGTSVGKQLHTIANVIAPSYLANGNVRLAIVCSARSGQTKALGTTNLLLQAASEALQPVEDDLLEGSNSLSNSVSSLSGLGGGETGGTTRREGNQTPQSAFSRNARSLSRRGVMRSGDSSPALAASRSGSGLEGSPLAEHSSSSASVGYNATVDKIMQDHLDAVKKAVTRNEKAREMLESEIIDDCERLRDFLMAAKIIEEISPKSKDIIMSIGERLSCRIVVGALLDAGIEAELVGLESIVDAAFLEEASSKAGPKTGVSDEVMLDQSFYDLLATKMAERLEQVRGVPVVTGYFGNVPGSLLSQVGRGYTDLCAALCAVGLQAAELQIWKEVDGVFTADPRKVSTARLIPAITPEEAAELTYYGSEVIHPFTMEQAIKNAVPIRIKNVENPAGGGTVIFPPTMSQSTQDATQVDAIGGHLVQPQTPGASGTTTPWGSNPLTSLIQGGSSGSLGTPPEPRPRKLPTAVTIKDDVWVLNVHSNRKTLSHGFFARIFGTLDRHGVVVDLISTSEVHVSMALHSSQPGLRRSKTVDRLRAELSILGTVSLLKDMAILSLVGTQMRNMVGVAGKMFATLAEGNINIEMISQGANEINISCVIHKKNALKALNLIHYSVLEVSPKANNLESGNFGRSFF